MDLLHEELTNAAIDWFEQGAFLCPPVNDGSKAPAIKTWRNLGHDDRGTLEGAIKVFSSSEWDGIGLFTGSRSINIECTEFEGRAVTSGLMQELENLAADNGMQNIVDKLMLGYIERSPSQGVHFIYRVEGENGVRPNTVLARNENNEVLAESRGEGGYIVLAPSGGRSHHLGAYEVLFDRTPEDIVTLTIEERDQFWALIQLVDKAPTITYTTNTHNDPQIAGINAGTRPGDDYNERATWDEILTPHGWTTTYRMGNGHAWKKPGKTKPGISATTGQSHDGVDRLYVFSTSTVFEAGRPYNKFSAWTLLNHQGDYRAAARELGANGYGQPATITPLTLPTIRANQNSTNTPNPPQNAPNTPQMPINVQTGTNTPIQVMLESEDATAIALINEYAREIRYCPQMGRWLYWTGNVWEPQTRGGMISELIKAIGRSMPETNTAETRHKRRILSASGNQSILTLASTDPAIIIHVDELDQRPLELNTPAGIINLTNGQLMPANPAALHTKTTSTTPDFNAPQDAWTQYLQETFNGPDQQQLIGFIQRLLGYTLLGEVRDNILPVFYGSGANGKTVIVEVVQDLLADYAIGVNQKFLVQGPDRHSTEIAKLAGIRLAVASETNEGEKFDEAKVKLLTGGDRLTARFMRQDEATFMPSHTLIQLTNHKPDVQSGGKSFWRRLRLIPFNNTVPDDKIDLELRKNLVHNHGPAILAWLIQGTLQYLQHGLAAPEAVLAATNEYALETDSVARFLADTTLINRGVELTENTKNVNQAYESWCQAEDIQPVTAQKLGRLLASHGIDKTRSHGARYYTGLNVNHVIWEEIKQAKNYQEGVSKYT